jgi:hypothetical protein
VTEKHTSDEAAESASEVLQDGRTSDDSRSAAGSALAQAGEGGKDKQTGKDSASSASNVLRDDNTGEDSQSAAGSALSQRED